MDNKNIDLHKNIKDKLAFFIKDNKIPHILFHGPSGSGKRTLVYKFVSDIYNNDKNLIKNYTMFANCAHGKGIKFVRDELKFFAKTNINIKGVGHFKTIVLTNADKLTTDAQSALRRCIELFSHNTRFFIIVENKYNLLKPILSRLCEIYFDNSKLEQDLYNTSMLLNTKEYDKVRYTWLENEINKLNEGEKTNEVIIKLVNKLYEKGYSSLDLMNLIEKNTHKITDSEDLLKIYTQLMLFNKVKTEFRNEKLFMTFILVN
jgi:DNA polymerase III delta prime subunit